MELGRFTQPRLRSAVPLGGNPTCQLTVLSAGEASVYLTARGATAAGVQRCSRKEHPGPVGAKLLELGLAFLLETGRTVLWGVSSSVALGKTR